MPGAEKSIIVNTSPEVLYDVIADYEKYPEFLKDISAVRVIERSPQASVVEFTVNLIKKVDYTIRLTGERPRSVSWTLVKSSILKANNGGWTLEDLGGGRTKATYRLELQVSMFVPGRIADSLTGSTLPATLEAFKARAEQQR